MQRLALHGPAADFRVTTFTGCYTGSIITASASGRHQAVPIGADAASLLA
jgi:hypothetical protein